MLSRLKRAFAGWLRSLVLQMDWWNVMPLREGAILPTKAKDGDLAWDIYYCPVGSPSNPPGIIRNNGSIALELHTGIAMAFPKEFGLVLRGKSGLALKYLWEPIGGVIDSGYRGELIVLMSCPEGGEFNVPHYPSPGDKICQGIFVFNMKASPNISYKLPDSSRGKDGFGSTGC